MKKLLLFIALIISGLGLNAQQIGDWFEVDELYYEITSKTPAECSVASYDGNTVTSLTIPSVVTYNGVKYSVTAIDEGAFKYSLSFYNVEIPASVTHIGKEAFCDRTNLQKVTFGENSQLAYIGEKAFYNCHLLASMEIPSTVTCIGDKAFSAIWYESSPTIANGLDGITFGENSQLTYIGVEAFCNCGLDSIEIPANVTYIGDRAFYKTSASMTFEENSQLTYIGEYAFRECEFTSIEIPSSVTYIGDGAFYNSEGLTRVVIPYGITHIGDYVFWSSELTSVEIHSSVNYIGESAFGGCEFTSIEIPSSVNYIGESAFSVCESLTSVTFGENLQLDSIRNEIFYKCSNLTSIEIPSGVTYVGDEAFYGCESLTSIEIPSSVTYIGKYSFYDLDVCVCYAEDVPETDGDPFYFSPQVIYVPEKSIDLYKAVSPWNEYEIIPFVDKVVCNVSVTVNPKNAGTVSGAGEYEFFDTVTLIATANKGYEFMNWIVVNDWDQCDETEYSFIVIKNVELFANFAENEDYEELEAPTNLRSSALSSTEIQLQWDVVEGADSYNVYQSYYYLGNVSDNSCRLTGLNPGEEACFTVTSVKGNDESEHSNETCITPKEETLSAPTGVNAVAQSHNKIKVTWNAVTNAKKYEVYRNNSLVKTVTTTSFTDSGLESDTEYCYKVKAVKDNVKSQYSSQDCATTPNNESISELSSSMNIYPNPVNDKLYIETEIEVEEVVVYDVYGRQQVNETTRQQGSLTIDITNLNSGVYFVKIATDNGNVVKRIVKN